MDNILKVVKLVALADRRQARVQANDVVMPEDSDKLIRQSVPHHGVAFNKGMISIERLIEVVVMPFVFIMMKLNRGEDEGPVVKEFLEMTLDAWFFSLGQILTGKLEKDAHGVHRVMPLMSVTKRGQLIKALLNSNFHQVREIPNLYLNP